MSIDGVALIKKVCRLQIVRKRWHLKHLIVDWIMERKLGFNLLCFCNNVLDFMIQSSFLVCLTLDLSQWSLTSKGPAFPRHLQN